MADDAVLTHTGRQLIARIDAEMAHSHIGRPEFRALLRDLRIGICDLSADLWAAEAGAGLDGCIIGMLREAAKKVTGGNNTFADGDLAILAHLAQRAVDAGLTDKLHASVRRSIAKAKAAKVKPRKKP